MDKSISKDKRTFLSDEVTIDVDTGGVEVSAEPVVLQSVALGSCIALVLYQRKMKIGGLAHIMLPGPSPSSKINTKYTVDAIDALLDRVTKLGAGINDLEISVVGGANVLQEGDIPDKVTKSVLDYLQQLNLVVNCMRVGGVNRRSVFLETKTGDVYYTESDDPTRILLTKTKSI